MTRLLDVSHQTELTQHHHYPYNGATVSCNQQHQRSPLFLFLLDSLLFSKHSLSFMIEFTSASSQIPRPCLIVLFLFWFLRGFLPGALVWQHNQALCHFGLRNNGCVWSSFLSVQSNISVV